MVGATDKTSRSANDRVNSTRQQMYKDDKQFVSQGASVEIP